MREDLVRTAMLIGEDALARLASARVAIFGVGGVGGYAVEALARSGVGTLDLIDSDEVAVSNLNRQIIASRETVGVPKVDAFEQRIHSIFPDTKVVKHRIFYLPGEANDIDFSSFDYIVDAVDTVSAKLDIIVRAEEAGVPVISAMGCGNRLDPTKLVVTDIYKTHTDPLAKVMRTELRKRGVRKLKVVYSEELPIKPLPEEHFLGEVSADAGEDNGHKRRSTPGSTAFVPGAAGLIIASVVVRELAGLSE